MDLSWKAGVSPTRNGSHTVLPCFHSNPLDHVCHFTGQILRNAACLSAITRTPITVEKIRAGRDKPGLRPQHLTGLKLVEAICGEGSLSGGKVGSTRVSNGGGGGSPGGYGRVGSVGGPGITLGTGTTIV